MRVVVLVLLSVGCATAGDDGPPGEDAAGALDGAADAEVADAGVPHPDPDAFVADATPCTVAWVPLLANGDFDLGHTAWTETTSNGAGVLFMRGTVPATPQSGDWLARHLGSNGETETLAQTVNVPAGATALRLRGYRCFVTTESTTTTPYDRLNVELREGGATVETLAAWSNLDATAVCSWSPFELVAASPHDGRAIELETSATSDGASVTSMYLDTLTLEAEVCQF